MMMGVLKSIKPLSIAILLGSILISYGYLKIMDIGDLTTMYQTIFGGKPLNGIMLKSLFIMVFLLLQYIQIDYIAFYIDNTDSLFVRYGSKGNWLKALLKGTAIITAVFVILFYFIWLLLDIVLGHSDVIQSINMATIGVIARIYLFCTIVVLVQIYLLLKLSKSNTFMFMGGISIVLAMTSHYQDSAVSILPQSSSSSITFLNAVGNILFALILAVLIKKISFKKELSFYES